MDGESLTSYYAVNSILTLNYGYSIRDLEDMIPWERDAYITYLNKYIESKNKQQQE